LHELTGRGIQLAETDQAAPVVHQTAIQIGCIAAAVERNRIGLRILK
jgi:hypothetical protein